MQVWQETDMPYPSSAKHFKVDTAQGTQQVAQALPEKEAGKTNQALNV